MRTPLLLALAATALVGCAGSDRQIAASGWCETDLARHGVVVTARGTRLALRPAAPTPLLQRASLNQAGSAVLTCRPKDGALAGCVVLYEDPGRQGFGKLALGYADRVIYPSDVDDGVTAEVRFRFDSAPRASRTCS